MNIKNEIYKSLINYTTKGFVIDIEKLFIYNTLIVAIISDYAINQYDNIEYYYGIYDIDSKKAIPQYSKEYMDIIKNFPQPCKLLYQTINFMEQRRLEKEEEKFFEDVFNGNFDIISYQEILKKYRDDSNDEKTVSIYNYFLNEDDISYSNIEEQVNTINLNVESQPENLRNLYMQKINPIGTSNFAKKEDNYKGVIITLTIIGVILGFLTATLLFNPFG